MVVSLNSRLESNKEEEEGEEGRVWLAAEGHHAGLSQASHKLTVAES